jgi:hypothetical protein
MRDAPTPSDLLQLATDVAAASGGAALNANDRAAALRLLDALCSDADAAQVTPTLNADSCVRRWNDLFLNIRQWPRLKTDCM